MAELSASENTHDALVTARLVPALLPFAGDATAPADVRMEAVVTLSNLAENPATHAKAFAGDEGAAAFGIFVELLREDAPELQREGFRALSCLALARAGNVGGGAGAGAGGAVPDELLLLLLEKASTAAEVDRYGKPKDDEVAFHAVRDTCEIHGLAA